MKILVVGLGKLGLPFACTLAKHGIETHGFDVRRDYLEELDSGTYQTSEPECDYSQINIQVDIHEAVWRTDMAMVCVQTPEIPGRSGEMDIHHVIAAVGNISRVVEDGYPVIINSTVVPGTAERLQSLYPHLTIISNPVWIALGNVVHDLENPPAMVIGYDGADASGAVLDLVYVWRQICDDMPTPIYTDNYSAEFMKLAHNAWCCMKMSWMGALGDHNPRLNIKDLEYFMSNGGERPGAFWKYGPSFGGPCFPRDLRFWINTTHDPLAEMAERINMDRIHYLADRIIEEVDIGQHIVILGASYKAGSTIMEESPALALKVLLEAWGYKVSLLLDPIPEIGCYEVILRRTPVADCYVLMHRNMDRTNIPAGGKIIDAWEAV